MYSLVSFLAKRLPPKGYRGMAFRSYGSISSENLRLFCRDIIMIPINLVSSREVELSVLMVSYVIHRLQGCQFRCLLFDVLGMQFPNPLSASSDDSGRHLLPSPSGSVRLECFHTPLPLLRTHYNSNKYSNRRHFRNSKYTRMYRYPIDPIFQSWMVLRPLPLVTGSIGYWLLRYYMGSTICSGMGSG